MRVVHTRFGLWMVAGSCRRAAIEFAHAFESFDGREAVFAALEALEADADVFAGLSFEALSECDCVAVMSA